jgi:type I restriction enzyme R subunit
MIEFKQIIGRGTRIYEGKYYFTIWDFVHAYEKYSQPDWDGEPVCPKCGNNPCTCADRESRHYSVPKEQGSMVQDGLQPPEPDKPAPKEVI